jgi:predicted RNA-binding protein with PIN domain
MNNEEITNTDPLLANQGTAPASAEDDNIFNEIFGEQEVSKYVAPIEPKQDEGNLSEGPVDVNPKEDPNQFQYWQSQADKKDVELQELKARMDKVEQLAPPVQSAAPVETQPEPTQETVQKPVKPARPNDFDSSEALTDPNSKSAKYVAARDQYLEEITEYNEFQVSNQQQLANQQKQQAAQAASQAKLINDLQTKYSYTPEEANDFIVKMSSPESLSLDNLVKLHRGDQQQAQPVMSPSTADLQLEVMRQRKEKLAIPKPITTQPSANVQSSRKIEDQMMDSMIGSFKKKNPFS